MDVGSSSWLDGKKILLTGATGYLGKVICEKLLRECIGIRKLYILIRVNEKEDLHQRIVKFKNDVVFDRVKSLERGIMDKVIPIEGDLSKVNLQMQDFDRDFLRMEVNVIIHAGCQTDLYVNLKDAILTNVRGTKCLLQLAELMSRLESFVYVSHIFSNCYERIIEEKIYPPRYDANDFIKMFETGKPFTMESKILREFSSFYLFSQHLAESLLARSSVPTALARLPTLTPSLDEPYPGWIDTSNHLDNLLMFAGNGSVQSLYGKPETPVDIIPVDLAAKGVIAVAQNRLSWPAADCRVYNLTESGTGEISWKTLLDTNAKITIENPFETSYWYPGGKIHSNYYMYVTTFILFQVMPAIVYDILSFLCTGRIQFVRQQLELFKQLETVERFFNTVWMFNTENADELFKNMSFTKKLKFKFRTQKFDIEEYMRIWNNGRRTYLLQLHQKASKIAKCKLQGFSILSVLLKTIFIAYVGHEFLKMFGCEQYFSMTSNLSESCRCSQLRGHLFSTFQKI